MIMIYNDQLSSIDIGSGVTIPPLQTPQCIYSHNAGERTNGEQAFMPLGLWRKKLQHY